MTGPAAATPGRAAAVRETAAPPRAAPMVNLDLRVFAVAGLYALLFAAPFLRGLFFEPDFLPVYMAVCVLFALTVYDKALRRETALLQGPGALLGDPMDRAALGLVAAYALSLLVAADRHAAVLELLKVSAAAMVCWIARQSLRAPASRAALLRWLFLAAGGVAAVGVAAAARAVDFPGAFNGRVMGPLQYPNALAAYLMALALAGAGLWLNEERPAWRAVYGATSLVAMVAILGSYSRGVWLVYPAALLLLVAGLRARQRWTGLYTQAAALTVALLVSRRLLPRFAAAQGGGPAAAGLEAATLKWLLAGAAAVVLADIAFRRATAWVEEQPWSLPLRRAVGALAVAYVAVVGAVYFTYAASALPSGLDQVVARPVLQRAESIRPEESSLQDRLLFSRDALRVVADRPLLGAGGGGWNALYHQYQSSLYWTTEVHNHFFQVWVETGTLGFAAYLALWGLFIRRLIAHARSMAHPGADVPAWSAGVGALALGAHSALDFDLSLPAIAITLWSLWALVPGEEAALVARPLPGAPAGGAARRRGVPPRARQRVAAAPPHAEAGRSAPGRRWYPLALAAGGTAVAALAFTAALRVYQAGQQGALGARAMLEGDLAAAERFLAEAHRLNPRAASYAVDLARVHATLALPDTDPDRRRRHLEEAERWAAAAEAAQPRNLQVQRAVIDAYRLQGRVDRAAAAAERFLTLLPLHREAYETAAAAYVAAARAQRLYGDRDRSLAYAEQAIALPGRLEERRRSLPPGARRLWQGSALEVSPALRLAAAQGLYLKGDYDAAAAALEPLARDGPTATAAGLWRAAALEALGRGGEAEAARQKALAAQPDLEREYEQIVALAR